jgi:hypothetical protein
MMPTQISLPRHLTYEPTGVEWHLSDAGRGAGISIADWTGQFNLADLGGDRGGFTVRLRVSPDGRPDLPEFAGVLVSHGTGSNSSRSRHSALLWIHAHAPDGLRIC